MKLRLSFSANCVVVMTAAAMLPLAAQEVTAPPAELKAPEFYTKYLSADGYPIVASVNVTAPGPLTFCQACVTVAATGSPSSVTFPLREALPGSCTGEVALAVTNGAELTIGGACTSTVVSENPLRAVSDAVRRKT